jgi:hypothetical protein
MTESLQKRRRLQSQEKTKWTSISFKTYQTSIETDAVHMIDGDDEELGAAHEATGVQQAGIEILNV